MAYGYTSMQPTRVALLCALNFVVGFKVWNLPIPLLSIQASGSWSTSIAQLCGMSNINKNFL